MSKIRVGDTASVIVTASGDKLAGKVTRKYTGTTVSSTGAIISNVEITVSDTNGIAQGDEAAVVIGSVSCNEPGTFVYANEKNITATTDGTVETLNYRAGDTIENGAVLLAITNDQTLLTLSSNEMSVTNAKTALENAQNKLSNYIIKSTIAGTVIEKSYALGDDLEGFETLAVIADMSTVTFDIDVDEQDIASIKTGQSVSVTADALTDKEFDGKVTYVSSIGATSSGVTTYPVTVTVQGGSKDGLMMDMNVTGIITVNSVTDVLRVPIAAVVRGNQVLVKTAAATDSSTSDTAVTKETKIKATTDTNANTDVSTPSGTTDQNTKQAATSGSGNAAGKNGMEYITAPSGEVPEGYEYVKVTTGASNDTYIEIQSGLSEGDTVAIPIEDTETASSAAGGLFGIGGGMPSGQMPNGGPPSGGNWGGNRSSGSSSNKRIIHFDY
jgi:HlyD family secretion protein